MASMSARTMHTLAEELGVDPELVGALVTEQSLRSKDAVREAVAAYLKSQEEGTSDATPIEEEAKPEKKKKAGLTLSQRRALLRLLDSDEGISPPSPFRALPFEYLVDVGLAMSDDGVYRLTEEGFERAESINPGYRAWSAGETVVLDADGNPLTIDPDTGLPIRPPAGTHRSQREQELAEKAEAKAKADAEKAAAKEAAEAAKAAEADSATPAEEEAVENDGDENNGEAELATA